MYADILLPAIAGVMQRFQAWEVLNEQHGLHTLSRPSYDFALPASTETESILPGIAGRMQPLQILRDLS